MKVTEAGGGWASPLLAKKSHYFGADGRSLCGGWMYLGETESNQDEGATPNAADCMPCWRKRQKARAAK